MIKFKFAVDKQGIWEKKFAFFPVKLGIPYDNMSGTKVVFCTVYRKFVNGYNGNKTYEYRIDNDIKKAYNDVQLVFKHRKKTYGHGEIKAFPRSDWDEYNRVTFKNIISDLENCNCDSIKSHTWAIVGQGYDYWSWIERCIYANSGCNI